MSSLKTRYLVAYNTAQSLGWLWLLVLLVPHLIAFLSDGWVEGNSMAFTDVKHILLPLQATASLEVIHNLAGWVMSSPFVTLTQVRTYNAISYAYLMFTCSDYMLSTYLKKHKVVGREACR